MLLLTGLYAEAQLWACKQAAARKWEQVLPDGSVIHRRIFIFPQCVGANQQVHDTPCKMSDLGWIDENRKFHMRKPLPTRTYRAVMQRLVEGGYVNMEGMP